MTQKSKNIIGWVLTGLLAFIFAASAIMKFSAGEQVVKSAVEMGITLGIIKILGVVELLSILLFIFPRTGILGTLLLTAYLGGAIATHLEHQQPIFAPVIIQCLLWITATIRFSELSNRIVDKKGI